MTDQQCQCCAKVAEIVGLEPEASYDAIIARVRNIILIASKQLEGSVRMPPGPLQPRQLGPTGPSDPPGATGATGPTGLLEPLTGLEYSKRRLAEAQADLDKTMQEIKELAGEREMIRCQPLDKQLLARRNERLN